MRLAASTGRLLVGAVAAWCLAWAVAALAAPAADKDVDHCLSCHSTPAKLVPAIREIAACVADVPTGSAETAGEG